MAHRRPLPDGITPEVAKLSMTYFGSSCGNLHSSNWAAFPALVISPFIALLVEALEDEAHRNTGLRLALFAAHDATIIEFLSALQAFDNEWPGYVSRSSNCIKTPTPRGISSVLRTPTGHSSGLFAVFDAVSERCGISLRS